MPTYASVTGSGAGSFFVRLGHLAGFTNDVLSLAGGSTTSNIGSTPQIPTRLAQIQGDYAAGTAAYQDIANLTSDTQGWQSSLNGFAQTVQGYAQATLLDMINTAVPMDDPTSVDEALFKLETYMGVDTATIDQGTLPAVGAQTNAPNVTPTGNPTFVWSVKDAAGRACQYLYGETATVRITQDNQNGATKGSEPFAVTGQNAAPSLLSWDWFTSKYGSGASIQGNLVDPLINNTGSTASAGANLLVNGAVLVATTSNQCDNFTILTGTAGSTITVTAASGGYITGSGVIVMVSDGSTDLAVTQSFNTASTTTVGAGGTPYVLVPSAVNDTQYAVYVPFKQSVSNPVAGVLQVDLVDSTNTIVQDDQGTSNSKTVTLGGASLGTGWQILSAVFRMPKALTTTNLPYKLRIWQSTAVSSGCNISLSCMAMAVMQRFYNGGGSVAGLRGSTDVLASGVQDDSWTFAFTNTPGKMQKFLWRCFDVANKTAPNTTGSQNPGIIIPAAGSPSVSDTLVA